MQDNLSQRQILSVSQLNQRARQLLETHLPLLWVEAEISNFSRPSSGHWYFTLKDANAQIRCAMFRNRNQLVRQLPQAGQQVLVRGRVSLYEGRGDYQLIVEHMEESGFGVLQRNFEALKTKLHQEGLFAVERKRALPALPRHIGVITSPSGAAIHDILTVLRRRFPAIPVTLLPVAVQGNEAAPQICAAIERANHCTDCDVLIVGRGGGSLEDLWPFNEESVARAIAASRIPVVSAVGHEVDTTISDYVADMRAPTPSAAAELLTPDQQEIASALEYQAQRLTRAMVTALRHRQQQLGTLRARLRHPGERLQTQAQRLDHLEMRLRKHMQQQLQQWHWQINSLHNRQKHLHPEKRLNAEQQRLQNLHQRLQRGMAMALEKQQQRLRHAVGLLDSVSPLNTLKRGYAIVRNDRQQIIRHRDQVSRGERITIRLGEGEISSRVEDIQPQQTDLL